MKILSKQDVYTVIDGEIMRRHTMTVLIDDRNRAFLKDGREVKTFRGVAWKYAPQIIQERKL